MEKNCTIIKGYIASNENTIDIKYNIQEVKNTIFSEQEKVNYLGQENFGKGVKG